MSCSSGVCRRGFDPSGMGDLHRHVLGMLLLLIRRLSLWICSSTVRPLSPCFLWMHLGFSRLVAEVLSIRYAGSARQCSADVPCSFGVCPDGFAPARSRSVCRRVLWMRIAHPGF